MTDPIGTPAMTTTTQTKPGAAARQPIPHCITTAMQPYQKRFLAALESDNRIETPSEHWTRERIESKRAFTEAVERINDAASALAAAFAPAGQAARRAQAAIASFKPIARQILEAERGAPLGRKRRARRARGRRRHA